MAEVSETTSTTETGDSGEQTVTTTDNQQAENDTPSIEELMAQLAEAKAETQRYKNKADKASSEAAESKRALRARQTAEEREAEEKAEAQRLADEENKQTKNELNQLKAQLAYRNIKDADTVNLLIEAVTDADHQAVNAIFESLNAKAVKEAKAEWIKTAPPINAGSGDAKISKEQFDNMSMTEKTKLYRENIEEYNRLSGKK